VSRTSDAAGWPSCQSVKVASPQARAVKDNLDDAMVLS
jgi:hypothetical protein